VFFRLLSSVFCLLYSSSTVRRILHIDMDAFYASVEQRDRPDLRGRPVAVGGRPEGRGVVAAASYEARAFGVRSAISMARAVRLCPGLVVVPPDFAKYRAVSSAVFALFRAVTPLVEPLSLDEAYLDVTENAWNEPLAVNVARRLKTQIHETTGLTASAGVAPNKFLAKIASGWKKPDGLTVVAPERVEQFLQQLPVDALWGVGPVTAARLRSIHLERLADVRQADLELLRRTIGSHAGWLVDLAHGIDNRPVEPFRPRKSVGTERTFSEDIVDRARIVGEVTAMAEQGAGWLARKGLFAKTVTIKVRYGDFTTVTRSDTRTPATETAAALARRAVALLDRTEAGTRPVRLLGVSLHGLVDEPEPPAPQSGGRSGDLPFDEGGGEPPSA
jgi:DNA polymerase-4